MANQVSQRLPRSSVFKASFFILCMTGIFALVTGVGVRGALAAEVKPEAVYAYCLDCHGNYGAGGQAGLYPRIAGLPQPYLDAQIHAFKAQDRDNKPMIPIFKHVNFNEEIIDLVSAYIASMSVPDLGLWPHQPDPDALAAFASREDYVAAGKQTYQDQCANCHGEEGQGTGNGQTPPLVAQYPAYLAKQIRDFATGKRKHVSSADCGAPDAATADAVINHLVELGR
ncbi:Cytochrome c4 precursor [Thiorhodovibrio winogradskyi]|uniref:Cytochrome c4 n=1 Tax=Thiorhodovibrio winogradskyi TaxID=77007 RepID=A0ABZ0SC39_9GAMM|nr:c-type cytochrome [Thiorhodovibrio winogradskyi]